MLSLRAQSDHRQRFAVGAGVKVDPFALLRKFLSPDQERPSAHCVSDVWDDGANSPNVALRTAAVGEYHQRSSPGLCSTSRSPSGQGDSGASPRHEGRNLGLIDDRLRVGIAGEARAIAAERKSRAPRKSAP